MVQALQKSIFNGGSITIPHYILIDENGTVLSVDFTRPSDPDFNKKINLEFAPVKN